MSVTLECRNCLERLVLPRVEDLSSDPDERSVDCPVWYRTPRGQGHTALWHRCDVIQAVPGAVGGVDQLQPLDLAEDDALLAYVARWATAAHEDESFFNSIITELRQRLAKLAAYRKRRETQKAMTFGVRYGAYGVRGAFTEASYTHLERRVAAQILEIVARCSCGLSFTAEAFARLSNRGYQSVPADPEAAEHPKAHRRPIRNCYCGSTIAGPPETLL